MNRRFSKTPRIRTSNCTSPVPARPSPSAVRHGMNRSHPAVSVPIFAAKPSEMTIASLNANNDGMSFL